MSRSMGARRRNSVRTSSILKGGWVNDPNNPGKKMRGPKFRAVGRYVFLSQTFREIQVPNEISNGVFDTKIVANPPETARRIDGPNGREYVDLEMYKKAVVAAKEKIDAG